MGQTMQSTHPAVRSELQRVLSLVFGILAVLEWAVVGLALVIVGAKFREIFADFGVELPALTRSLIRLANNWLVVVVLVLAAIIGTAFAALKGRAALTIASFLLALLTMLAFVIAMYIPLVAMINGLNNGEM
jgi:type II secretory pathway component PulF